MEYWRQRNRAPCGYYTTQKMTIDTASGPYVYATNPMSMIFYDKTYVHAVTAIITSLFFPPKS